MNRENSFRQRLAARPLLFDGAMGTQLYSKGIFINRCFEEANLSHPALVEEVHREFIGAGSDVIETNTYGANRRRLAAYGLDDRIEEINVSGVEIARRSAGIETLIAGSVGPIQRRASNQGDLHEKQVVALFREHIGFLIKSGVDVILLESIPTNEQLDYALAALRSISSDMPVIAQLTHDEDNRTFGSQTIQSLSNIARARSVDAVGVNCGRGPDAYLEVVRELTAATDIAVSVMPNAGEPRSIEDRQIYLATPDYFGVFAKRYLQSGARIIGGCCGTTPAHIEAAKKAMSRSEADHATPAGRRFEVASVPIDAVSPAPLETRSAIAAKLGKSFLVSIEIDPPTGADPRKILDAVRECRDAGVDCINIGDGPRASARMSPIPMAAMIHEHVEGIETIIHVCCRDRNVLGLQADLLGADALGLRNVVIITGDPPKLGNYPFATGVFELDSIGAIKMAQNLNSGMDVAGHPIKGKTELVIATGAEPGAPNMEREIDRFRQKVEAGAEIVMTQPVFDVGEFEKFVEQTSDWRIPILVGILPIASLRNAEFLNNEVPGINIPKSIMRRMAAAKSGDEARAEGIAIAREMLRECRSMVAGTYIMPPFNRHRVALDIIKGL